MSTPETKTIKTRFQLKNDTPANWTTASQNNFVPLQGEPILYKDGTSGAIYGMKVGDGTHTPDNLDFICDNTQSASKQYVDTGLSGKLDKNTSTSTYQRIYGIDTAGNQMLLLASTDATINHVVKRTTNGNITVPTTPNVDSSATSKQYVDQGLTGKLDKNTSTGTYPRVYAVDQNGSQTTIEAAPYKTSSIVVRNALGQIQVPSTPTDVVNATSKYYVDTQLATKQNTLTAGTGIDITNNVISATGGGNDGCQLNTIITINVTASTGYTINFTNDGLTSWSKINWGDGTVDSNYSHTYTNYGIYVLVIEGLTSIPMYFAYRGEYMSSSDSAYNFIIGVQLGENVTYIDMYAFEMCSNLKQITIPENVDSIGMGAFFGCNNLARVEFEAITPLITFSDDHIDSTFPEPGSYPNFKIIVPEESKAAYTTKLTISHQYNIVSYSTGSGGGGSSPTWTSVNSATTSSYSFQEGIYTFVITQTTSGYNMTSTIYVDPNNMTYARGTASYNDFTGSYIGIQYEYVMDPTFSIYGGGDSIVGYFFTPCSTT